MSSKALADKEYILTQKIENTCLERHILNSLFSLSAAFCPSHMETLNPPRDTWIAKGYQKKLWFNRQTASDSFATNQSKQQFYINGIPKAYPRTYLVRSKRSPRSLGIFLREITSVFNYSKAVYYWFLVVSIQDSLYSQNWVKWNSGSQYIFTAMVGR